MVEVAGVLLEDGRPTLTFESLVSCDRPIPPQASAVHHIRDEHLVGAPSLFDATAPLRDSPADYYAAHNAKFDRAMLGLDDLPWICTYRCALRRYSDAPSYSNQVLRYHLGLPDPSAGSHAHRAMYDAEVTASLLSRMLADSTTDDVCARMAELSAQPALLRKVTFGAHRDKLWSDVPASYLQWMLSKASEFDEDRLHTARHWLARRGW